MLITLCMLASIGLWAASCTSATPVAVTATPSPVPTPTPTPQIIVEEISITNEDDIELAATLFTTDSEADIAVVLAHMGDRDLITNMISQGSWRAFARIVAGRGFAVLTFDFRCHGQSHCGSGGIGDPAYHRDVRAVLNYLDDLGFEHIVCAGASMGGTACVNAATERELAGLIIIASPIPRGVSISNDLTDPTMPKLFISAEYDHYGVTPQLILMHEQAPEPKELAIFPGEEHGTNLFHTESGEEFSALMLEFLEDLRQ
jgi:pimeloyl-ACP methyl ester carboxylesterase